MKFIFGALVVAGFLSTSVVRADNSLVKTTAMYVGMVAQYFEADHAAEVGDFVGIKTKQTGMDTHVYVGLTNGKVYDYPCMVMGGGPMCHRQ